MQLVSSPRQTARGPAATRTLAAQGAGYKNRRKWPKIGENGPKMGRKWPKNGRKWAGKCPKMAENGPKISQKNGPQMARKWPKTDDNDHKRPKIAENGLK